MQAPKPETTSKVPMSAPTSPSQLVGQGMYDQMPNTTSTAAKMQARRQPAGRTTYALAPRHRPSAIRNVPTRKPTIIPPFQGWSRMRAHSAVITAALPRRRSLTPPTLPNAPTRQSAPSIASGMAK